MTNDSPDNLSPYAIDRSALLAALTVCLTDNQDNQQLTLLALVDLKHFGQINQRYGYLVGDRVLVELQQRLAAIPKHPLACRRIDGDKFALIISPLLHIQLVPLVAKKIIDSLPAALLLIINLSRLRDILVLPPALNPGMQRPMPRNYCKMRKPRPSKRNAYSSPISSMKHRQLIRHGITSHSNKRLPTR